jgi:hypothetical protein
MFRGNAPIINIVGVAANGFVGIGCIGRCPTLGDEKSGFYGTRREGREKV